jgi:lysophospholipase L1-like esterase
MTPSSLVLEWHNSSLPHTSSRAWKTLAAFSVAILTACGWGGGWDSTSSSSVSTTPSAPAVDMNPKKVIVAKWDSTMNADGKKALDAVLNNVSVTNWRPYDLNPTPPQILQNILQGLGCNIFVINASFNGSTADSILKSINTETWQPSDSLSKILTDNKANFLITNVWLNDSVSYSVSEYKWFLRSIKEITRTTNTDLILQESNPVTMTGIPTLDSSLKPRLEKLPAFIEAMNDVAAETKSPIIKLHDGFKEEFRNDMRVGLPDGIHLSSQAAYYVANVTAKSINWIVYKIDPVTGKCITNMNPSTTAWN